MIGVKAISILLRITIFLLVYIGFYSLFTQVIITTESKAVRLMYAMKPTDNRGYYQKYIESLGKRLSKFIFLETFASERLKRKLEKIGEKNKTPQEYIAEIWVVGITWAFIAIFLWLIKFFILSVGCVLVGLASSLNKAYELNERTKEINSQIEEELPQFIRSFGQALEGEKDIIKILEKYRQICGNAFKYDLDVLITDLKTGNNEEALYRFDERLNIPIVTSFVSGLVGTAKGIDQKTFFYILERDIKILAINNLKKVLDKRPQKIKIASTIVVLCFVLIFTYPLLIHIIKSLQILK